MLLVQSEPPPVEEAARSNRPAGHRCRHGVRYTRACLQADWAATNSSIAKIVILVYRVGHLLDSGHVPGFVARLLWPVYRVIDGVWSKLLAGADLHHTCCIGPGLRLAHGGRGVVVGPGVVIGADVAIYHEVTLGTTETRAGIWPLPVPVIGDLVRIGVGAKVLGELRVGAAAVVGANAVVLGDVPAGASVKAGDRWP